MKNLVKSNIYSFLILFLLAGCISSASTNSEATDVAIQNPHPFSYKGIVEINLDNVSQKLLPSDSQFYQVLYQGTSLPVEAIDSDANGVVDQLLVEVSLTANEKRTLQLSLTSKPAEIIKKTQSELWHKVTGFFTSNTKYIGGGNFQKFDSLRVPDGFSDHAYFIKYEGPGWESDKVGYRLYLDWRNAVDVFGKKVDSLVLQEVGIDGYESYHHIEDWGMDVMKVGSSLGIGSNGFWNGTAAERVAKTDSVICKILDGNLRSQVKVSYYGWQVADDKVNMVSMKSIDAGSRMTHEVLSFDKKISNLCTGIRKEKNTDLITLESKDGKWGCLATYGKQSLNSDHLGLAVLYRITPEVKLTEDANSHVVILGTADPVIDYYFLAAWEQEKEGIKSKSDFMTYLEEQLSLLERPIIQN